MKGFIEGMIAWWDFDTGKYHWHYDKNKNPDQLELPLDEPTKVPKETQET
jgi:hypothetical protein